MVCACVCVCIYCHHPSFYQFFWNGHLWSYWLRFLTTYLLSETWQEKMRNLFISDNIIFFTFINCWAICKSQSSIQENLQEHGLNHWCIFVSKYLVRKTYLEIVKLFWNSSERETQRLIFGLKSISDIFNFTFNAYWLWSQSCLGMPGLNNTAYSSCTIQFYFTNPSRCDRLSVWCDQENMPFIFYVVFLIDWCWCFDCPLDQ